MSLFGTLKGKLHKKSLDEEIDDAFGHKEPFSKKVLDAHKRIEGEDDPDYNKFAGRSAESFHEKTPIESANLAPELKLQQHDEFQTLVQKRLPLQPEPLAVHRQTEEVQSASSPQHQQLASKIQALQRRHNTQLPAAEPALSTSYVQQLEPQVPITQPSSDLSTEIQELKEQNKKIIEILRDIQKNLRI